MKTVSEIFISSSYYLKAIGRGVKVKKSCQAKMNDLLTRKQMLCTDLQNSAAFKSNPILKLEI